MSHGPAAMTALRKPWDAVRYEKHVTRPPTHPTPGIGSVATTASEQLVVPASESGRQGRLGSLVGSPSLNSCRRDPRSAPRRERRVLASHRNDLPIADDWREYLERQVEFVDLATLFKPVNDTLYPVGQILDVAAHYALGGNSVVYQFLSMVVVLGLPVGDAVGAPAAGFPRPVAHSHRVRSLLPDATKSYVLGRPECGLSSVTAARRHPGGTVLALRPAKVSWWAAARGVTLGFLAGMTYVSGAFGALAAGGTITRRARSTRQTSHAAVLRVGAGLAFAGVDSRWFCR